MTITMHIGHDKTGSSAIQSALALNENLLRDCGLEYLQDGSFEDAARGHISSGNRAAFRSAPEFRAEIDYLFSGEAFVKDVIAENDIWKKMVKNRSGISKVIIYTRDLFGHFFSQWGQSIKRGGSSKGADIYAKSYDVYPKLVRVIDKLEAQGIPFELYNYSKHQHDIVGHFMQVLLPNDYAAILAQIEPVSAPVNRSLSLAEYELQKHFNRHYGKMSSRFVSDALVNRLPNIASEKPVLDQATIERVVENNRAGAERLNGILPEGQKLDLEVSVKPTSSSQDTLFGFSAEQLGVVAESVCQKMEQLEVRNQKLLDKISELRERL
jgi:hypothetical protein